MTPTEAAEIRELASAADGIRRYAAGDYFGNRVYAAAVERYERALLQPAVAAARGCAPATAAEDPRDATIRELRALLGRCAGELDRALILRCEKCCLLRRAPGPCPHCRTDAAFADVVVGGADILHGLLAALRSAGVEPTPAEDPNPAGWAYAKHQKTPATPEKGPTP